MAWLWRLHRQAVKPLCRELHGPDGTLTQACADASAICSVLIPALQRFAKDLMCFMPYWERDPQCVSKVLTCMVHHIISELQNRRSLMSICLYWHYHSLKTVPIIDKGLASGTNAIEHLGTFFDSKQQLSDQLHAVIDMHSMGHCFHKMLLSFDLLGGAFGSFAKLK